MIEVANSKQRDAPAQAPIALSVVSCGESAILSHSAVGLVALGTESELVLLTVLRDSFGTLGASKTEWMDAADMPKTTFYRSSGALVNKGLVIERREGRSKIYTLAADNQQTEIPTVPPDSQ